MTRDSEAKAVVASGGPNPPPCILCDGTGWVFSLVPDTQADEPCPMCRAQASAETSADAEGKETGK
jgi:hypothetical protein